MEDIPCYSCSLRQRPLKPQLQLAAVERRLQYRQRGPCRGGMLPQGPHLVHHLREVREERLMDLGGREKPRNDVFRLLY